MAGSYLGPEFTREEVRSDLDSAGAKYKEVDDAELIDQTSEALAAGKAVGWFQGRMEFGPRSLGARSIIADPQSPTMQKMLNLKVKYRESFRPFAPSVLCEDVADWFELESESPYMLLVANVIAERQREITPEEKMLFGIDKLNVPRSQIPAVTHVDYSARVQTVHRETNPRYHDLISAFKARTGCPVLVNTSFNVRGEPIVLHPNRRLQLLYGHRTRPIGRWKLHPAQGGSRSFSEAGLQRPVRTRLISRRVEGPYFHAKIGRGNSVGTSAGRSRRR